MKSHSLSSLPLPFHYQPHTQMANQRCWMICCNLMKLKEMGMNYTKITFHFYLSLPISINFHTKITDPFPIKDVEWFVVIWGNWKWWRWIASNGFYLWERVCGFDWIFLFCLQKVYDCLWVWRCGSRFELDDGLKTIGEKNSKNGHKWEGCKWRFCVCVVVDSVRRGRDLGCCVLCLCCCGNRFFLVFFLGLL